MNRLLQSYSDKIEQRLERLHALLESTEQELERQREAREKLVQQYWSRGKELSVLNEATKSYAALQEDNKRLRDTQQQLQERLARVLEYTKLLSDTLRQ
ncbi:MAG: hypothetical protein HYV26_12635 [Candidatus Hydrogenedentes bacterium]|nr:hypothetical protein [Candidatus Hydrogenedentota bacterium]MBI3119823.1 hypothetical protein [Candidatus Hydrogenedentota bacterium]